MSDKFDVRSVGGGEITACPNCGKDATLDNPVEKQFTRGEFRGFSCRECVLEGRHIAAQTDMGKTDIVDKLRAVLRMTNSTNENEAATAMEHLERLLTQHNLSIMDLEMRGKSKPGVEAKPFDLGKAAFRWKLDLATTIADYYYCVAMVDTRAKTVQFLGRPENVKSMSMLYEWVMDQIKAISSEERKKHQTTTGEHVDPLRWQVNFGLGAVHNLGNRLRDMARQRSSQVTSLVLSHRSEISDYMEEKFGYRVDGQDTKATREWRERYQKEQAEMAALKERDIEAYYKLRPWERPERVAQMEKEAIERQRKEAKRQAAADRRRRERNPRERKVNEVKEEQEFRARAAGRERSKDINLQPFVNGKKGE